MQLNSKWNEENELNLSKKHNYSGWCKTDVRNGTVKKPHDIKDSDIPNLCQDCINYAKKSSLPTPEFLKSLKLNTA